MNTLLINKTPLYLLLAITIVCIMTAYKTSHTKKPFIEWVLDSDNLTLKTFLYGITSGIVFGLILSLWTDRLLKKQTIKHLKIATIIIVFFSKLIETYTKEIIKNFNDNVSYPVWSSAIGTLLGSSIGMLL